MDSPEKYAARSAEKARVNWSWIGLRLSSWRCHHDWMVGDRKTGAKACRRCGVWRWWPRLPPASTPGEGQR